MATKKVAMPSINGKSPKKEFNTAEMTGANIRNSDYPAVKTSGTKIRGTGAATKGVMARGPLA